MAKPKLKKKSNRVTAKLRYKIEKKVRQHNCKARRNAKKNQSKKSKPSIGHIPNICPFKQQIIEEFSQMQRQKVEEQLLKRDKSKMGDLERLKQRAETLNMEHEQASEAVDKLKTTKRDSSLKAYYKEFKKVIDAADVILEVIDARDPLGTRSPQVEQAINPEKRLVLVLNKCDLVPRQILDQWLRYLRQFGPCVPFKASTQTQQRHLGQRKMSKKRSLNKPNVKGSNAIGVELLMSLLANYSRNHDIKQSIRVGVVGLPNVGKSSVINSLSRARVCNVGAVPGVTRQMQQIQLDTKIQLLDCPGIVFETTTDGAALKNTVKVTDPIEPARLILKKISRDELQRIYDLPPFYSPEEFFNLKAQRMGQFRKGGVPNVKAAAQLLLRDWNSGKIKYYTVPPELPNDAVYISSEIVQETAPEFSIDSQMEVDTLDKLGAPAHKGFLALPVENNTESTQYRVDSRVDEEMALPPPVVNLQTNQTKKLELKKRQKTMRKIENRLERVA